MNHPSEKIKMIISDVDGVWTDGSIFLNGSGEEFKKFSVLDSAGIAVARMAGLKIVIISGRYSKATEARANELKIEDVYNGTLNKLIPYNELKEKYNLKDEEIDIPVMERVGAPIAVSNAYPLVKEIAVYITETAGGEGAFREAVDWVLKGQGRYEAVLTKLRAHVESLNNTESGQ
jgi:3-deoxy-D-manno-octulosonate 8-phosphate phosphatase (KDO 8-P phosphatase)